MQKDFNVEQGSIQFPPTEPGHDEEEEQEARLLIGGGSTSPPPITLHSPTKYHYGASAQLPSTPSDHASGSADHAERSSPQHMFRLACDAGVQDELTEHNHQHMKDACEEASKMLATVSVDALQKAKKTSSVDASEAAKKTKVLVQESTANVDVPYAGDTLFPTVGIAPLKHLALYRSADECNAAVALYAMDAGPLQGFSPKHSAKCRSYCCSHVVNSWGFSGKKDAIGKQKWPNVKDYCKSMLITDGSADPSRTTSTCYR